MLTILSAVGSGVVLLFGFVVLFGAPYLPTMKRQTEAALDMLALKKGQALLELGSGDGRFMRAAARRGIRCVGYEINPLLVVVARVVTWRYRRLVTIKFANYWRVQWPPTDGIYVFLLQKYMTKLDTKVAQHAKAHGVQRLVSYTFTVPGKESIAAKHGLFLYEYKPEEKTGKGKKKKG